MTHRSSFLSLDFVRGLTYSVVVVYLAKRLTRTRCLIKRVTKHKGKIRVFFFRIWKCTEETTILEWGLLQTYGNR